MRTIVFCGSVDLVGDSLPTKCEQCGVALVISPGTKRDAGECAVRMVGAEGGHLEVGEHQLREMGPRERALAEEIKALGLTEMLRRLAEMKE